MSAGSRSQHREDRGPNVGSILARLVDPWWFSQLLSTSTAALNYLRVPWTWSGEVFHILILIQEWGVGGKKVEGSIAFISELILLRKPKLKHLSASQIKRFSSRLRLIGWIRPHSQAWSIKSICRLYLLVPSFFVSSECFYFPRQRGRWVMVWKDQLLGKHHQGNGGEWHLSNKHWGQGGHPSQRRAVLCQDFQENVSILMMMMR